MATENKAKKAKKLLKKAKKKLCFVIKITVC